jgi:hypothetical protein
MSGGITLNNKYSLKASTEEEKEKVEQLYYSIIHTCYGYDWYHFLLIYPSLPHKQIRRPLCINRIPDYSLSLSLSLSLSFSLSLSLSPH